MDPNSCKPYFLSKIEAIDINNEEDFKLAEIMVLGKKRIKSQNLKLQVMIKKIFLITIS